MDPKINKSLVESWLLNLMYHSGLFWSTIVHEYQIISHSYIEQPVTAVPAIETILWSVQKRITFSVTPTGIIRFAHDFVGLIMLLHTSGPELRCRTCHLK